jgi:uncharacterized phiE125 gp8 family phage protein
MIDVTAAKAHLRVETSDEDDLIGGYVAAAIGAIEKKTGKLLSPRAVSQVFAGFPCDQRGVRLWYGPIDPDTAALTIAYDDTSGASQDLGEFRLVEGSQPKLLPAYGALWPFAYPAEGSVRVSYTAGFADVAADAPELDQAVLMLVAHFYLNREAVNSGPSAAAIELPLGVEALIAPYRTVGLG